MTNHVPELNRLAAAAEMMSARLEALAIACRDMGDAAAHLRRQLDEMRQQLHDEGTTP